MFMLIRHNNKRGECAPVLPLSDLNGYRDVLREDPFFGCAHCHSNKDDVVYFETMPDEQFGETYAVCFGCAMNSEEIRWEDV
jgi:hypothetical protein